MYKILLYRQGLILSCFFKQFQSWQIFATTIKHFNQVKKGKERSRGLGGGGGGGGGIGAVGICGKGGRDFYFF